MNEDVEANIKAKAWIPIIWPQISQFIYSYLALERSLYRLLKWEGCRFYILGSSNLTIGENPIQQERSNIS